MLKWIRHNQGTFITLILTTALFVWTYGCESKVTSLTSDSQITRSELQFELDVEVRRLEAELETLQKTAALRFEQLDRLDAIKIKLFDTLAVATQAGSFNTVGLITLAGSLMSIGIGIDNRIKDKVIKNRPLIPTNIATNTSKG